MAVAEVTGSIEQYRRDGVSVVRQAVGAELVAKLAEATDRALADIAGDAEIYEGTRERPLSYGELQVWKRFAPFREAILQGDLARHAAEHMGSTRAQIYFDQLLVKEPGAKKRTPWHQDIPYWKVNGRQICSLWLALDRIPGSSALEFVRGSQDWSEHNPEHFMDGSPYQGAGLARLPDIEGHRDDYDIATFDLESGDAIIFQAAMVHGAPGVERGGRRRAYSTRWLGDDAVFVAKPGERGFPADDSGQRAGKPYTGPDYPIIFEQESVS